MNKFYDTLYVGEGLTTRLPSDKELNTRLNNNFEGTDKDRHFIIRWLKDNINGDRLLEFGSSWGYFLYQAQKAHFKPTGVEISEKRRSYGQNRLKLEIVPSMDILISEHRIYDAIVTINTLEHLVSIHKLFKDFHALLNKDGVIIIVVPFIDLTKGNKVFKIMGAVHPLGFSEEFFKANMFKEGFTVEFCNELTICRKIQ
jgi:cyclopropane fatty-acyl-phospholipid synthase-like methyltransferase